MASSSATALRVSTTSVSASGKRIQRDMAELSVDPPPLCSAGPKSDNLYHWVATIIGPPGTPYDGGIYFLEITFPSDYPFKPQKRRVKGDAGVDGGKEMGSISLNKLRSEWNPIPREGKSATILVIFKTRIYHCNVDNSGNVSLAILKDGWSPARTVTNVLSEIRSIFTQPDPYHPLVPGIAHLYLADRAKHDEVAAEWTLRFAK